MLDNNETKKQLWIWFFVLVGVLFFRYQYFTDVFMQTGFMASNTDVYYRLHRIEAIVNQPGLFNFAYPLNDPVLNFPGSWNVAWPLGLDLIFAVPLKWLGVHDIISMTFFVFLLIPLLIIPIVLLTASIIRRYAGDRMGLLGGVLLGVMPVLVVNTNLGNLDHHGIGILFVVLALYFLEKIKHQEGKHHIWFLALLIGISPSIDPHGWLVCSLICTSLLFEQDANYLMNIAKSFLGGFVLSLVCLSFSNRLLGGYVSVSGFSWWACIVIFSSCLFAKLLSLMRTQSYKIPPMVNGLAVALLFILPPLFSRSILHEIQGGINWLFLKTGTIGQTAESISLFKFPISQWGDGWLIVIMPLIMTWLIYRKKYIHLVLYALIPVVFSLFQVRFIGIAAPLCIILLILFMHDAALVQSSKKRNVLYVVVTAAVIFCFYPTFQIKNGTTDLIHRYFAPVRDASKFLKNYVKENPKIIQEQFKPAVIAPWDFGHWVLFFSDLPVVAHPFQGENAMRVNQLLTSEDSKTFEDFQKSIPARFLLIEQSIPRYFSAMEYIGKDVNDYFSITYPQGTRKIAESKNIENVFYHRFLFNLGSSQDGFPDHWRWMYASPYAAADIASLPALKIFERVQGVKIQLKSTVNDLRLQVAVQDQKHHFILSKPGRRADSQTTEWIVPYGQYNHGGVFCDGNFVITDSRNKIIKKLPTISNQQVIDGDLVIVR